MNIEFEDKALEELYTQGSTVDGKYRKLSKDVVKQYNKVVNFIRAARRIEDLYYTSLFIMKRKKET
jgi:proteic killer suppression protein